MVLRVPFVDVLTAVTDDSTDLAFAAHERDEWLLARDGTDAGAAIDLVKSYSPVQVGQFLFTIWRCCSVCCSFSDQAFLST